VGSGRQALFGWIVGRDGLQYRSNPQVLAAMQQMEKSTFIDAF
jgi:hypothetical protein